MFRRFAQLSHQLNSVNRRNIGGVKFEDEQNARCVSSWHKKNGYAKLVSPKCDATYQIIFSHIMQQPYTTSPSYWHRKIYDSCADFSEVLHIATMFWRMCSKLSKTCQNVSGIFGSCRFSRDNAPWGQFWRILTYYFMSTSTPFRLKDEWSVAGLWRRDVSVVSFVAGKFFT